MHDRFNCLFHPLVGISPLFACGLAATSGLNIQNSSAKFFRNSSRPGGILTTPGTLLDADAKRYKKSWEENYAGINEGRTAVLGNGLKYEAIAQNAVDSELVAQLKLSAEMVCSAFHVPGYKVGVGATPTYQNAEILNQIYYNDCLQVHIEAEESLLDDGLGLDDVDGRRLESKFNVDDIMRMDSATQIKTINDSIAGGWLKPNEGRAKRGYSPAPGGNSPMMQQQNYSLDALAKRDSADDPFASKTPTPAASSAADTAANDANAQDAAASKLAMVLTRKFMEGGAAHG
jgi:HK97 family phage portal protein